VAEVEVAGEEGVGEVEGVAGAAADVGVDVTYAKKTATLRRRAPQRDEVLLLLLLTRRRRCCDVRLAL
jgi:hypothetical protein